MSSSPQGSESIGPTAHYTGHVWSRNGLSHPALETGTGRLLFNSMRPTLAVTEAVTGLTLEGFLLGRHLLIDHLLAAAIDRGEVSQVLEVACGLSPRGWRFAERYGERVTYVEADLPGMAARKRRALERAGTLGSRHRVVEVDALSDDGPRSLSAVTEPLDPAGGLAIITEGLLSYLPREAVDGFWRRSADVLAGFSHGVYLSDVHCESENDGLMAQGFMLMLSAFVRGKVEIHFADAPDAIAALEAAGFARAELHNPADFANVLDVDRRGVELVRVIEATV